MRYRYSCKNILELYVFSSFVSKNYCNSGNDKDKIQYAKTGSAIDRRVNQLNIMSTVVSGGG
jgi:hypothetical protein